MGLSGWRYQLLPVPPNLLEATVRALPAAGFAGANVTIPHKEAALRLADAASKAAEAIGAANTLIYGRGEGPAIRAENTDAPALIAAIPLPVSGASALVLGAGGTARAAVWALLDSGASEVRVWNRTPERALEICEQLGGRPVTSAGPADVLINCTSIGLDTSVSTFKQLPLEADDLARYECVVDFVYSESETDLVKAASAQAVPVVDGRELLVRQGALSFELFTGRTAPIEAMRAAVRA